MTRHPLFSIIFLFLMCFASTASAQSFAEPKWSAKVLSDDSYQLIVIVPEPVTINELKTFKKTPGLDKTYLDLMAKVNKIWVEAVQSSWTLHKNITYKTVDEVATMQKTLPKEERAKYLVLAHSGIEESIRTQIESYPADQRKAIDEFTQGRGKDFASIGLYALEAQSKFVGEEDNTYYRALTPSFKEVMIPTTIAHFDVGNWCPSYADFVFALSNIQHTMQLRAKDQKFKNTNRGCEGGNPTALKDKTLLIPLIYVQEWGKNETLTRTMTDALLQQNYPYPFKVVRQDEIDRAVREHDKQYAVLVRTVWPAVPGTGIRDLFFWTVDAADGATVLSYAAPKKSRDVYTMDGHMMLFNEERAKMVGGK